VKELIEDSAAEDIIFAVVTGTAKTEETSKINIKNAQEILSINKSPQM